MIREIRLVGANADLFEAKEPEVLLCGPAGTGKTIACFWRIHHDLSLYPGSRALYLRKTRASATDSGLVTYESQVLPPGSPIADGAGRANRHAYQYPNGSELVVGGMDKPTRLYSTEWDLIYIQESTELTEAEWESLLRSLRHFKMPTQQIIADANPDHPRHWLKLRCDSGKTRLITGMHLDNPVYVDTGTGEWTERGKEYLKKLEFLSGVRRERLLFGRWSAAEGCVYEDWNESVHLVDRFLVPREWRRIGSIDFGYTNPFTAQWWCVDPDNRLILYRELYGSKRRVSEWAEEIKRLSGDEEIEWVADHDAEDRATLRAAGIQTKPAIKPIRQGIEAVATRLKIAGDGKPRLMLMRDSLVWRDRELSGSKQPCCLAEEIPGYSWPQGQDSKPVKEIPASGPDHGCDAMRYAVAQIDLKKVMRIS